MSDSDGSHSRQHMTQELKKSKLNGPLARRICLAARDVNGRRFIRT
jgi:hypothetical protein